jgi:hypothetical protein
VEKPRFAAALGISNARPQLPRPIGGLPDGEIHRLLLGIGQIADVGIAGHRPPLAVNLRAHGLIVGGQRSAWEDSQTEGKGQGNQRS